MNKISHSIVMVEDIHSSLARTEFSDAELDEAAQLILKTGGVITPPILLETGVDSFTIIDGEFEYYAALKAKEIDPLKGETINAYLVESEEDVPVYKKQFDFFRQRKYSPTSTPDLPLTPFPTPQVGEKDERLATLEKTISQLTDKIETLEKTVTNGFAAITALTPPEKPPTVPTVELSKPSEIKPVQKTVVSISEEQEQKFIEDVNTLTLVELTLKFNKVSGVRLKQKIIDLLYSERQKQAFISAKDMIKRTKGAGLLGKKTLINIMNQWI